MDLVSRLKIYLDSRQISITQFADECGIPRPTGSQLLAGRNKKVSDEIIGKIHSAYPDLNIVWLMFGEGNMENDTNIKTSEPQNNLKSIYPIPNNTENQQSSTTEKSHGINLENNFEKINQQEQTSKTRSQSPTLPGLGVGNTFTFDAAGNNVDSSFTLASTDSMEKPLNKKSEFAADQEAESITLTPGKGKRVTGIVVYYDDCTYESFIPDPNHSHPFINR